MNTTRLAWILALVVGTLTLGCTDNNDNGHEGHDHDGHEHNGGVNDHGGDAMDALKGLSAEDRALAMAQKTCPVSGEELGSMGTPIRMTAGDTVVFLCCKGCTKTFKKDPQKYAAMIKGGGK